MNKNEFLRAIADKTETTIKEANAFYEAFVETVQEAMKAKDKITLVGFGTFVAKHKNASVRPNPQNISPSITKRIVYNMKSINFVIKKIKTS